MRSQMSPEVVGVHFVRKFTRPAHALLSDQFVYFPGGTPLYGLYRYVRAERVWFFSRFGHK